MQGQIQIFDPLAMTAVGMTNRSICASNNADNVVFKFLMTNRCVVGKISLFTENRMFMILSAIIL